MIPFLAAAVLSPPDPFAVLPYQVALIVPCGVIAYLFLFSTYSDRVGGLLQS